MKAILRALSFFALGSVVYGEIGETRLLHPAPFPDDWFGRTLEVSGNFAVVGDAWDDTNGTDAGAVYIFEKTGSLWALQTVLIAPDGLAGDEFGHAVALEGDTLVVGSWLDRTVAGLRSGSTYVFVRDGEEWAFQAKLRPSDHEPNDRFGLAVTVHGDTLAAGSGHDSNDTPRNYIFKRAGTIWTEEANIPGGSMTSRAFDVTDDRFVLNTRIFKRTGTTWPLEVDLDPPPGVGTRVAIEDDLLVLTDVSDAAVVFEHIAGAWTQTGEITDPPDLNLRVARVSNGKILASYFGTGPKESLVYERSGTSWVEIARLFPAEPSTQFSHVPSISGDEVVIGTRVFGDAGEVYAFTLGTQLSALCDASDGSLALCPCGNPGSPDTGCEINQGTGGVRLDITGMSVGPTNQATAVGTGYPPTFTPGATLVRSANLHGAGTVVFGDGVFCLANPVVRLGGAIAIEGTTTHIFGHGAMAGSGTFYYQLHYRNTPAMFCTPDAFNLSSGRAIVW
jgi:hypothetical protein